MVRPMTIVVIGWQQVVVENAATVEPVRVAVWRKTAVVEIRVGPVLALLAVGATATFCLE